MTLGDGVRRNIADVEPSERTLLRAALLELNQRRFPGLRTDVPGCGAVSLWFKQDEIHQATHVHRGPEFLPWHRVIVNRLEELLRQVDPRLSLHYWDWTQDPRAIPNANLGDGLRGTLNLFTPEFMGYGGADPQPIGEPWLGAGFYDPGASPDRDAPSGTPADAPLVVARSVSGSPASPDQESQAIASADYAQMRQRLETIHDAMHGFVNMGGPHISFRDPFVFLLHSNVDRLFATWQVQSGQLDPATVYGSESASVELGRLVEPWSTGQSRSASGRVFFTRPWYAPENEGTPLRYQDPAVVQPPRYDTTTDRWRGPGRVTAVAGLSAVAGHFATGDGRHLVLVGRSDGRVHEVFWKPAQVGIEGEDDLPVDFGAGGIAGVGSMYNTDEQRHIALVGTAGGEVHEIYWRADTVGVEGQDALPVPFDPGSIVAVSGHYAPDQQRYVVVVATTTGQVHEIFWKSDTVGIEGTDPLPVTFGAGGIVDACVFYNTDERRNIVVVAEASGRLHEIFWKELTVGIEGHDRFPLDFGSGGIAAVSGFYDPSRQRHVVVVGASDGKVHQVYWKALTVGIEAHSVVAQYAAGSIVSVAGFYSLADQVEHVVVGLNTGEVLESWLLPTA
jgi:hypothetical protein